MSKPIENIPRGNSQYTPPAEKTDMPAVPEDEKRTGDLAEDAKKAISRIDVTRDFKDMAQWPCVRQSLLTAMSAGAALGAIRYVGSRRIGSASNWAMATFVGVAIGSHYVCEQQRAKEFATMRMIQEKYPHRHVSKLKRREEDWVPPPSSASK